MDGCEVEMLCWYSTSQTRNKILGWNLSLLSSPSLAPFLGCVVGGGVVPSVLAGLEALSLFFHGGCYWLCQECKFGATLTALHARISHMQSTGWLSKSTVCKSTRKLHNLWASRNGENNNYYIQILEYILFELADSSTRNIPSSWRANGSGSSLYFGTQRQNNPTKIQIVPFTGHVRTDGTVCGGEKWIGM